MRLHLRAITLRGFKSFASATHLAFEPGITCVVGPNGSGKSNIVDALAWVMGEQGPKTLRGGKMEDVIFAGTSTKAPLGRAEVELTIDNSDGQLPIEYSEVTISRTLFRNGASEYAINGESCRLLDIQELLSDTGLGREMHVIVGQGQLDTVLRATAAERRAFIEEAAGILKYRRRKEKTERKLDSMQANLIRLQDLIAEVRRNLKPLGRQAEVAKQAQEIAASVRELKSKLIALQVREQRALLEEISKNESERKAEASYAQSQLQSAREGIHQLEQNFVSDELDKSRNALVELERIESRIRNVLNLANQKLSMLRDSSFEAESQEVTNLGAQLGEVTQRLAELVSQQEQAEHLLQTRTALREEALSALTEFDAAQQQFRTQQAEQQRLRDQLENKISSVDQQLSALEDRKAELQARLSDTSSRTEQLESSKAELDISDSSSDDSLRKEYEAAQMQERQMRAKLDGVREELHAAERERDALAARHAALGLMLDQSDGARDIRKAEISGVRGLLAESIEIEDGYQVAIAAALGTIADAVAVESRSQALSGLRFLKSEKLGRADFLVISGGNQTREKSSIGDYEVASGLVTAPEAVLDLLSNFLIARDLDHAEMASGKEFGGKTIVTLDGDLLAPNLVRGGGSKQPSKLELAAERDQAGKQLEKFAKSIEKLSSQLAEAKDNLEQQSKLAKEKLTELQRYDSELAARAERVGRVIAQLESLKSDSERVSQEITAAEAKREELNQSRAELVQQLEAVPADVAAEEQGNRSELTEKLEQARAAELEVRVELGAIQERASAVKREQSTIEGRIAEAESAAQLRKRQLEMRQQELARAEQVVARAPRLIAPIEQLIGAARTKLRDLEAERSQQSQRLQQLRTQAFEFEQKLMTLNQSVHEVELRVHELRIQLSALEQRAQDELALSAQDLLTEHPEIAEPKDELEHNLRSYESKLSQLGAFNPLALEEFAALEERHRYLSEQLEDLNKARADLRGIISDLDQKMQQTFMQAFEDTQREFEKVFPILFPGGSGSISLSESDNLLETGVEVSVKPAGKRIERMSLLSGGERSLAAVALLIAIFKARPSPFYVFDEVEAALDDANLGRLLSVIETLRKESQLIIVTHQKRTMEIADALYGVSMRQDGITQVVGQKLEAS